MSLQQINNKEFKTSNIIKDKSNTKLMSKIGNYIISEKIGMGTFSKVCQGIHILTKQKVAIKILCKKKIEDETDLERILREIDILKTLYHPNISHLFESISTSNNFYLFMEYIDGGDLNDYILSKKFLPEKIACNFFRQLISVIEYLSEMKIAHRDIKTENILLDSLHKNIKVIDFGLSNYCNQQELLKSTCGSPCYASPEMLLNKPYKGICTDIWSSGIVLYSMLVGNLPFDDDEINFLYEHIKNGNFFLPSYLSLEAIDLLKKILQIDPEKRITLNEIKKHPWFNMSNAPMYKGININKELFSYDLNTVDYVINNYFLNDENINKNNLIHMVQIHACNKYTATYHIVKKYILKIDDDKILNKNKSNEGNQKKGVSLNPVFIKINQNYPRKKKMNNNHFVQKEDEVIIGRIFSNKKLNNNKMNFKINVLNTKDINTLFDNYNNTTNDNINKKNLNNSFRPIINSNNIFKLNKFKLKQNNMPSHKIVCSEITKKNRNNNIKDKKINKISDLFNDNTNETENDICNYRNSIKSQKSESSVGRKSIVFKRNTYSNEFKNQFKFHKNKINLNSIQKHKNLYNDTVSEFNGNGTNCISEYLGKNSYKLNYNFIQNNSNNNFINKNNNNIHKIKYFKEKNKTIINRDGNKIGLNKEIIRKKCKRQNKEQLTNSTSFNIYSYNNSMESTYKNNDIKNINKHNLNSSNNNSLNLISMTQNNGVKKQRHVMKKAVSKLEININNNILNKYNFNFSNKKKFHKGGNINSNHLLLANNSERTTLFNSRNHNNQNSLPRSSNILPKTAKNENNNNKIYLGLFKPSLNQITKLKNKDNLLLNTITFFENDLSNNNDINQRNYSFLGKNKKKEDFSSKTIKKIKISNTSQNILGKKKNLNNLNNYIKNNKVNNNPFFKKKNSREDRKLNILSNELIEQNIEGITFENSMNSNPKKIKRCAVLNSKYNTKYQV